MKTKTAELSGTVERITFTQSGAGNQWTTIAGVRYATYWDMRTVDWQLGDEVTFTQSSRSLWHGQPAVLHADNIKKVQA